MGIIILRERARKANPLAIELDLCRQLGTQHKRCELQNLHQTILLAYYPRAYQNLVNQLIVSQPFAFTMML